MEVAGIDARRLRPIQLLPRASSHPSQRPASQDERPTISEDSGSGFKLALSILAVEARKQKLKGGTVPSPSTFVNASRHLPNCRGDGVKNADMSLIKFFPIKEKVNLEFRSEFFNIFNRPQLAAPNTQFNGGSHGHITAQANLPRVIQFAFKVNF